MSAYPFTQPTPHPPFPSPHPFSGKIIFHPLFQSQQIIPTGLGLRSFQPPPGNEKEIRHLARVSISLSTWARVRGSRGWRGIKRDKMVIERRILGGQRRRAVMFPVQMDTQSPIWGAYRWPTVINTGGIRGHFLNVGRHKWTCMPMASAGRNGMENDIFLVDSQTLDRIYEHWVSLSWNSIYHSIKRKSSRISTSSCFFQTVIIWGIDFMLRTYWHTLYIL